MALSNIAGHNPAPGPQQPSKYPFVGANYGRYGEQPGFYYDPYRDAYIREDAESNPANKPKEQSLTDIVIPVAAVGGASALAQGAGRDLFPAIKDALPSAEGIKGFLGLGGASAPATATPATTGFVGSPFMGGAAQAAAPATTAATGGGGGMLSLGGIGSAGNVILPAAGLAGAYDLLSHQGEYSEGRSALQGVASGAAIGSYAGPMGAAIGAGVGGLIGLATSLFGSGDKWKTEGNRLRGLQDKGVYVPPNLQALSQTKGHELKELIRNDLPKDFIGLDPSGKAVNNRFANSRDERDLTPADISLYSAWAEQMPDWYQKTQDERLQWSKAALAAGAVSEHHGTVDIDFGKVTAPVQEKVDPFELVLGGSQKKKEEEKKPTQTNTPVLQYKDPHGQPGTGMMGLGGQNGRR